MDHANAVRLAMTLFAHYPATKIEPLTAEVYAGHFAELENIERAKEAIALVTADREWLPSWAQIREVYYSEHLRQKHSPKALPEPPLSEEQRQENLRRMRELVERYSIKSVDDDVRPA